MTSRASCMPRHAVLLMLILCYLQPFAQTRDQYNKTLDSLNRAIQLAPKDYNLYFQRFDLYYNNRMLKEAMADINTALKLDSSQPVLYNARGAVYSMLDEHQMAIENFTKAIQLNPKEPNGWYNRARTKYELEDMDGSCTDMIACYEVIKKYGASESFKREVEHGIGNYCDSSQPSYYYQRGIAYYNLRQFDKAIVIYNAGVKKFPINSMLLSFRGNAHFAVKDYVKALPDYYASIQNKDNLRQEIKANQAHTEIKNDSIDDYVRGFIASTQVSIAESKFALAQYEEALTVANLAIDNPARGGNWPKENAYNVRGNIYMALGKYREAIIDFDKCIQLNKRFALAYANRAIARINLPTQTKMISYSIRKDGGMGGPFSANWTMPLKTTPQPSDASAQAAIGDCTKAISIDPALETAWYVRGLLKKRMSFPDYCYDLLKAKDLGYPVEAEWLQGCIK